MQTFTDKKGGIWTVEINHPSVKRCRQMLDFDPLEIFEKKEALARIESDPIFVVDVLYAVCKPQADEKGITTPEAFGELLSPESVEKGFAALLEGAASFCLRPRERQNRGQVLVKMNEAIGRALELQAKRIETDLPRVLDSALASVGSSSGSAQESSGSTPAS
jgi:hypothetical protein